VDSIAQHREKPGVVSRFRFAAMKSHGDSLKEPSAPPLRNGRRDRSAGLGSLRKMVHTRRNSVHGLNMAVDSSEYRHRSRQGRTGRQREVALAFPIAPAHLFAVTRGVTDYASRHARWLLSTHGESANLPIQSLRGWRGDGIIAILATPDDARVARQFQKRGIPVVTFSATLSRPGVPRVRTDGLSIGRMAAEHLVSRGYPHFGIYGLQGVAYSSDRGQAFMERLQQAGRPCSMLQSPKTFSAAQPWDNEIRALSRWLKRLPKPVGIFAVNDYRAQLVTSACKRCGLRVPRDVGVIGADNNHVICEFSSPRLSSVDCNWQSVGFQAAELLDRLMSGQPPPAEDVLVPPAGVVQRMSSDFIVVTDPRLRETLDVVQAHLAEPFGVERLVAISGLPRRTLELAFARELGCSPYHFLCAQRVEKAKQMLAEASASLTEVARRCGFHDLRRFRLVFRRHEGISPAEYREEQMSRLS
jgi:LacI family transcriptional regulator